MPQQFDEDGNAAIKLNFMKKTFTIKYHNPDRLAFGDYRIVKADCDGMEMENMTHVSCLVKEEIEKLDDTEHVIAVVLG